MSRTSRLGLSLQPVDSVRSWHILNELVNWLEAGYPEFIKESLDSGKSMTIPAGYQHIVYEEFDIVGDLTIEGTLVIL